jgi:hypothetical protein
MSHNQGKTKKEKGKWEVPFDERAVHHPFSFFLLPFTFWLVAVCPAASWAGFGASPAGLAASAETSVPFSWDRLSLLGGSAIFKGETGVALGLRCDLPANFLVEWGGVLPHPVAGYAKDTYYLNGLYPNTDQVSSYGETHWALLYPLLKKDRIMLDCGAGLSLAAVTDHSDRVTLVNGTPEPSSSDSHKTLLSPLVQLGLSAALTDWLSVRLDAAWLSYANHDNPFGPTFGLGFSGIVIRPMLQIKL